MKILALDTTAKTASVALADFSEKNGETKIIAEYTLETGTHSTTLLPMIESVLALTGNSVGTIDLYAVSAGPGSFTGIRIGVSTVKGLAFLKNTPCVGVSSLDALAYGCREHKGIIVPALDARRETVYSAIYISDGRGNIEKIREDSQISFDELLLEAEKLSAENSTLPLIMPGDAFSMNIPKYSDRMEKIFSCSNHAGLGAVFAALEKWMASDDKSQFSDSALSPIYLKKSQAEREREEMLASQN
ncbi:MAG: tRNA (adenosine(37)-N6)-threonylcarbamoyltransferase complex dimerization subunit type 1 TsaB [Ruminococcaceae bacterium]|nr:tRNA (adenosine(37)-N6)-threonylcarbamoyltransferase complex dimerization subunit type 1 TsaB [Oscillospiraceae bacterium]